MICSGRNTGSSVLSYCSFSTGPSVYKKSLSGLASISMYFLSSAGIDIFDWKGFPFFWLPHIFHQTCFGCSRRKSTLKEKEKEICLCFSLCPLPGARGFKCLVSRLIFQFCSYCMREDIEVLVMWEVCNCVTWKSVFQCIWNSYLKSSAVSFPFHKCLIVWSALIYEQFMYKCLGPGYHNRSNNFRSLWQFVLFGL